MLTPYRQPQTIRGNAFMSRSATTYNVYLKLQQQNYFVNI